MGGCENKVCLSLGGQPVIVRSLAAFATHPYVDALVLVVREDERAEMEALVGVQEKPCRIVIGGVTRQASVHNAIADLKSEIVLVHDGARPFVQAACITACIEALRQYDGVIPALPIQERVYSVGGQGVKATLHAQPLYGVQTPQCFHTKILRRCHELHKDDPAATDDSRLLELEGYKVGVRAGDAVNIKITTPLDLLVAQAYLEK